MSPCKFPQHHQGLGAGAPAGLLIVIALTAVIVTHWRDFIIAIVTTACLLVAAGLAVWLFRNHGSGYDPELERQAALERAPARRAASVSVTSAPAPAVAAPAATAALDAAPVVHQHLHLHGLSGQDMAEVVRKTITR